jgi:hypothetical protein
MKVLGNVTPKFQSTATKILFNGQEGSNALHKHALNGSQAKEFLESFLQEQGSNAF